MEVKKNSKQIKIKNKEDELEISDQLKYISLSYVPSHNDVPSHSKVMTENIIPMLIGGGILNKPH